MSIAKTNSSSDRVDPPQRATLRRVFSRRGRLLVSLSALSVGLAACAPGEDGSGATLAGPDDGQTGDPGGVGSGAEGAQPSGEAAPTGDPGLIGETPEPADTAGTPEPEPAPTVGSLSGVAWMPGNSPEHVEEARAMPASAALIQLSKEPLEVFPDAAYCNVCIEPEGFFATTDAKGLFLMEGVPAGTYLMTIEKGQFRKQREVTIVAGQVATAETEWTTLPSNHAPESGDYIPRIAMVIGQYDPAQFVLGKLGIGVEASGAWVPGTAMNRVDVFVGDDASALDQPVLAGTLEELVGNLDQLSQYHLLVIPCGPSEVPEWLKEAKNLENLRAYVAAGGGLFLTGWSGTYADALFPAQLEFVDQETPATAYDVASNTWDSELFKPVSEALIELKPEPRVVDADLSAWLLGQEALKPPPEDVTAGNAPEKYEEVVDANIWGGSMDAQIANVNEVTLGLDANGDPILDTPRILVDAPTEGGPRAAVGVLFRPAGCGRVMYSSYELDGENFGGSTPVERILMYSLMELSVCEGAEPPVVEEPPPPDKPPVPIPLPK